MEHSANSFLRQFIFAPIHSANSFRRFISPIIHSTNKFIPPINVTNPWDDQKQMVLVMGDQLIRLKILAAPLALPSDFLIGLLG